MKNIICMLNIVYKLNFVKPSSCISNTVLYLKYQKLTYKIGNRLSNFKSYNIYSFQISFLDDIDEEYNKTNRCINFLTKFDYFSQIVYPKGTIYRGSRLNYRRICAFCY